MPQPSGARYAILGWLSIAPCSGFELRSKIQGSISMFWNESFGSIYPMLKRLVDDGAIERVDDDADGHPSRKVYAATAKGRDELRQWLGEDFAPTTSRNQFALKLFFGAYGTPKETRAHVLRYRKIHAEGLAVLAQIGERLESEVHETAEYRAMTVDLGRVLCQATIDWCDRVLDTMKD